MKKIFLDRFGSVVQVGRMKKVDPIVVALQSRAFEHRIKPSTIIARAGVSSATWARWAAGGVPDLGAVRRMESALEDLIREAEAAGS